MRQPAPVEGKMTGFQTELHRKFNLGNFTQFTDAYDVKHKPGVSLYVPINGTPTVVVFDSGRATVYAFNYARSSGTDAMRARIQAEQFFNQQPTIH